MRAIPAVALAMTVTVADEAAAEVGDGACPASDAGEPYYDPCSPYAGWLEFTLISNGTTIPADGVLLLQAGWRGEMPDLGTAALTVTSDGEAMGGTFAATQMPGLLLWRPEAAWTPGATYTIEGAASNPTADGECLQMTLPLGGEVTIDAEAGAELVPVDISAVEMVNLSPTVALDSLACCEGVSPTVSYGGCFGEALVEFDPTQCTPFRGTGFLSLTLTGTAAGSGAVEQQILYVLKAEGQPESVAFAPMFGIGGLTTSQCAAIDAIDLGSGVVTPGVAECFGEGVLAQLGPQIIDPAATLTCPLQVCGIDGLGEGWDLETCTPYGGTGEPTGGPEPTESGDASSEASGDGTGGQDDDDKGCACAASTPGGPPLLGLLGLVWLTRRRRRG